MREDARKGGIFFTALGVGITLLIAAGALLDRRWALPSLFEIGVKALAVAALIVVLRRLEATALFSGSFLRSWTALILPAAAFQFLLAYAPATKTVAPADAAAALLSLVFTVLWEELLFRGLAVALFEKKGRLPVWSAILSVTVFAACHLVNLFSGRGMESVLLQVGYAVCFGAFLLGLFLRTRTLLAPMAAHFLLNGVRTFFDLRSGITGVWSSGWFLFVQMLLLLFLGVWMLWKPCSVKE